MKQIIVTHKTDNSAIRHGMTERILNLHGIHNFRDYGGYRGADGAALISGALFRSGQHVDATDDDHAAIASLDLRTVIDLRGDGEREREPCRRGPQFKAKVLFVAGETSGSGQAPHVEAARSVKTAAEAHDAMARMYDLMPFRPKLIEIFRLYFASLADEQGGSLIHCLAGKDRTGLAVAILHRLMGVHDDDVMSDYMLTNVAGDMDRRIAAGAETVRRNFGAAMDDEAVRTLMSVHPDFLTRAFAAIEGRYGNLWGYAEQELALTAPRVALIRQRLLV